MSRIPHQRPDFASIAWKIIRDEKLPAKSRVDDIKSILVDMFQSGRDDVIDWLGDPASPMLAGEQAEFDVDKAKGLPSCIQKPTSTPARPAKPPGAYPTLSYGDRGAWVEYLQYLLGGLEIDGMFGVKTERRVREFQYRLGIIQDGDVVPFTWHALELERAP